MAENEEDMSKLFKHKDKSPMVFCLRPCLMKAKVQKLITEGGGLCFPSMAAIPFEYKDKALSLLPDGGVSWDNKTISARYIIDCSKQGKILPHDRYLCTPVRIIEVDAKTLNKGRREYTKEEDINILLYVRNNAGKRKLPLSGNMFWKKLEELNMIQLRGRTWSSLKDRYSKYLKGHESEYPLEGRDLGPLPTPPERIEKISSPTKQPVQIPTIDPSPEKQEEKDMPGLFLAEVESKRNKLSPSLSRKEYDNLIDNFVAKMQKETDIDSKSIHKVLYKCNGMEDVAKHYLIHGSCPEDFHLFSDDEDKILLKCLLNPTTCDETPAKLLGERLGKEAVHMRAAALIGVTRSDFDYWKNIPLKSIKTDSDMSSESD